MSDQSDSLGIRAIQLLEAIRERFEVAREGAGHNSTDWMAGASGNVGWLEDSSRMQAGSDPKALRNILVRWRALHGLPVDGSQRDRMDRADVGVFALGAVDRAEVSIWSEETSGPAPVGGEPITPAFPGRPDPSRPIGKKLLREFWNDAWIDDDGVLWQVCFQGFSANQARGVVIKGNEAVGQWSRTISLPLGIVQHDKLILAPSAQGQGFAARWLERSSERYQAWGIEQVRVFTGLEGTYRWARKGFDFEVSCDHDQAGDPCRYEQSVYADKMRQLIGDAQIFWDSGSAHEAGIDVSDEKLDWLHEKSQAMLACPPRLTELVQLEPSFARLFLHATRANLSIDTRSLLPKREHEISGDKPGPVGL